jgi:hypothetical protein
LVVVDHSGDKARGVNFMFSLKLTIMNQTSFSLICIRMEGSLDKYDHSGDLDFGALITSVRNDQRVYLEGGFDEK